MALVLGLTGGIGMGKSTVARWLRDQDIQVFCADEYVHRLLGPRGNAARAIIRSFPDAATGQKIDRTKLGQIIFKNKQARKRLENILHPLVRAAEMRFVTRHQKSDLIVLDIPLLYETGAEILCDAVMVVDAPASIARARVLARPGMTPERYALIKAAQMPNNRRKKRADFVLDTNQSTTATRRDLQTILRAVKQQYARNCS